MQIRISGAVTGLQTMLDRCGWQAVKLTPSEESDTTFNLHART
jgi:hypothetical protein